MGKHTEGKSALDIISAEQKSIIFKERIRLMNQCTSAKDYELNAALIHMMNPSIETMRWVIHYLKLIEDGTQG